MLMLKVTLYIFGSLAFILTAMLGVATLERLPKKYMFLRKFADKKFQILIVIAVAQIVVGILTALNEIIPPRPPHGEVMILSGKGTDGHWQDSVEMLTKERSFLWWHLGWAHVPLVPDNKLCEARALRIKGGRVLVIGGGAAEGCADNGVTTNQTRFFNLYFYRKNSSCADETIADCGAWTEPDCKLPPGECSVCMMFGRNAFNAIRLENGNVFVYGGCAGACYGPNEKGQTLGDKLARAAEIFKPSTNVWQATPPSLFQRAAASAVAFGASVLVCGGNDGGTTLQDTCEIYDQNWQSDGLPPWRPAGKMPSKTTPQMVVMANKRILAVSSGKAWLWKGEEPWYRDLSSWEGEFWTPTADMVAFQEGGSLTLLKDGRILYAGGRDNSGKTVAMAQVFQYDTATGKGAWQLTQDMKTPRFGHASARLSDNRLIVAGGCGSEPLRSAEVYDPEAGTWQELKPMSQARCNPLAVEVWDDNYDNMPTQ